MYGSLICERQRKDPEGSSRATTEGSFLSDIRERKGQEKGGMERERERERESMLINWTTEGEREDTKERERERERPRQRAEKRLTLLPLLNYSIFHSASRLLSTLSEDGNYKYL